MQHGHVLKMNFDFLIPMVWGRGSAGKIFATMLLHLRCPHHGNVSVRNTRGVSCLFEQRGSCMVWEINMGVCPRLDFENIMLFN